LSVAILCRYAPLINCYNNILVYGITIEIREPKILCCYMMPSLHVYNGLARPTDESVLAWVIGTAGQIMGHSENIIAPAVHSLCRHKKKKTTKLKLN